MGTRAMTTHPTGQKSSPRSASPASGGRSLVLLAEGLLSDLRTNRERLRAAKNARHRQNLVREMGWEIPTLWARFVTAAVATGELTPTELRSLMDLAWIGLALDPLVQDHLRDDRRTPAPSALSASLARHWPGTAAAIQRLGQAFQGALPTLEDHWNLATGGSIDAARFADRLDELLALLQAAANRGQVAAYRRIGRPPGRPWATGLVDRFKDLQAENRRVTQKMLARDCGVDVTTLRRYLRDTGRRWPLA